MAGKLQLCYPISTTGKTCRRVKMHGKASEENLFCRKEDFRQVF